jgi:hypothetical protein
MNNLQDVAVKKRGSYEFYFTPLNCEQLKTIEKYAYTSVEHEVSNIDEILKRIEQRLWEHWNNVKGGGGVERLVQRLKKESYSNSCEHKESKT